MSRAETWVVELEMGTVVTTRTARATVVKEVKDVADVVMYDGACHGLGESGTHETFSFSRHKR